MTMRLEPPIFAVMHKARFQNFGAYLFVVSAACGYYLANAPRLLGHYDLGWHLAAGDLIRRLGQIPRHDPWSFTAGNQPWFNLSWLWDALSSAIFQTTRFDGLVALTLACGAAIAAYLVRLCLRENATPMAACIATLSASLLYPSFATFPDMYLAASPNMFTMLFAVVFYGQCLQRERLAWLPVMMALWANLHGGFLIGLFIVGAFLGLAALKRDWRSAKYYALTFCACAAAALVNPLGWHIYAGVAATLGNVVQAYITEWWPYYRDLSWPGSLPNVIYILLFAALELRSRNRRFSEPRLLTWLFLMLGLYQFRYMAFFFLFSTLPMAEHMDRLLPQLNRQDVHKALRSAGAVTCALLPIIYLAMRPAFSLPQMITPADVHYLETHYPHARMLNHWNYGGLLIYYDRGSVPIFVDGRAATAYPESVLRDYFPLTSETINAAAWDKVLAKYHVDTVMWMNTHTQLRQFLTGQRGWREVYRGSYASLYVSPAAARDH